MSAPDHKFCLRWLSKLGSMALLAALFAALLAAWPQSRVAAIEPSAKSLAKELVSQLGHAEFAVRERAAAQLVALEADATDALAIGQESPNREIRQRSTKLLAIVSKLDLQRRFDAFKQATDPTRDYGLPGWNEYRDIVSDSPAARSIFVLMYESEPRLLGWNARDGRGLSKALHLRAEQLRGLALLDRSQLGLGSIAALMFVATRDNVQPTRTVQAAINAACNGLRFQMAIQGGPTRKVMAALTERWIADQPLGEITFALYVALSYDLKGSVARARDVLDAAVTTVADRGFACLCVAKFGDEADAARLERYLTDASICDQARVDGQIVPTKVQDVALFALLEVADQEPENYGFDRRAVDARNVIQLSSLGFLDERRRVQAIAAWRTYKQNDPDKQ